MFCDITESDIDKILESLESVKEKVKNLTDRVEKLENMPPKEYFECKHIMRPLSDHDHVHVYILLCTIIMILELSHFSLDFKSETSFVRMSQQRSKNCDLVFFNISNIITIIMVIITIL